VLLEALTSEVCCGSHWHPRLKGVQGDDDEVASLPFSWEACHLNLVNFVHGKTTPVNGVQGDDHVAACALMEAYLILYPWKVVCVLGMASLLCQVSWLVACVSGVEAFLIS